MRRTVLAIASGTALALSAGTALAGNGASSTVKITGGGTDAGNKTYIEGTVGSPKDACERHRKVTVVGPDEPGAIYGTVTTTTNNHGKWTATGDTYGGVYGDYTAKVKRRVLPSGTVCKPDASPVFTLEH